MKVMLLHLENGGENVREAKTQERHDVFATSVCMGRTVLGGD
jgi:hypothetical protein